jgi:hypothetical protein
MVDRAGVQRCFGLAAIGCALVLGAWPAPAAAQDTLLEFLQRSWATSQPAVAPSPAAGLGPPGVSITVRPHEFYRDRSRRSAPSGTQYYCVRLCDGRFFPLARNSISDATEACNALCPASHTEVFFGNDIDSARESKGKRYADLRRAFAYREEVAPACTCKSDSPLGLASVDIHTDKTLRRNDLVVLDSGVHAFTGFVGKGDKQRASFVPVNEARGLSRAERRTLSRMRIGTGR